MGAATVSADATGWQFRLSVTEQSAGSYLVSDQLTSTVGTPLRFTSVYTEPGIPTITCTYQAKSVKGSWPWASKKRSAEPRRRHLQARHRSVELASMPGEGNSRNQLAVLRRRTGRRLAAARAGDPLIDQNKAGDHRGGRRRPAVTAAPNPAIVGPRCLPRYARSSPRPTASWSRSASRTTASTASRSPDPPRQPGSPPASQPTPSSSSGQRSKKADLLIVHHGLFWGSGVRTIDEALAARLRLLFDASIALAAYHLPLDAHPELGNNALLAHALGAEHMVPFGAHRNETIGFLATLPKGGIPAAELLAKVEDGDRPRAAAAWQRPGDRRAPRDRLRRRLGLRPRSRCRGRASAPHRRARRARHGDSQ